MEMYQAVLLTSQPISTDTLAKIFQIVHGREGENIGWRGTMFKLRDTVEIENIVSQPQIEAIYGKLAQ